MLAFDTYVLYFSCAQITIYIVVFQVLVKLDQNGVGDMFELDNILTGMQVTMKQFVQGCIAAGCDYLPNVQGIGINRAFTHVKSGQLFAELKKKGSDHHYEVLFEKAFKVFKHQTIFNPALSLHQPLNAWIEKPSNDLQSYCGEYP